MARGRFYGKRPRRLDPVEEAYKRQQFEAAQVINEPIVLASRHNFNPPLTFSKPQIQDLILRAARPIVAAESFKTFTGFCNPLHVEPLFSCNVQAILQARQQGISLCAMYAVGRYGMMAKVQLSLHLQTGEVLVTIGQGNITLKAWLEHLPPAICSMSGERGNELLRQWYLATDQPFRLMELPPELRFEILDFAIGADEYRNEDALSGEELFGCFGFPVSNLYYVQAGPSTAELCMLNKQVYNEMANHLRLGRRKYFAGWAKELVLTPTALSTPSVSWPLHSIRVLELEMPHKCFIQFFGVKARPFENHHDNNIWQGASLLANLPQLEHLVLRFCPPIWARNTDPWVHTGAYNPVHAHTPLAFLRDWRGSDLTTENHTSCQKILIDWILTYAKEYIENIPKVTLCGYIKHSTKAKWTGILADERAGRHHDVTEAKKEIESELYNLGPSCFCSTPCAFQDDVLFRRLRDKMNRSPGNNDMLRAYQFDFED